MKSNPPLSAPQASIAPRFPGRNRFKADVLQETLHGRTVAVKTFRDRPWWIRVAWGRFWIRRERRALGHLMGMEGLPQLLESAEPDPFSLRTDWIEAAPLTACCPDDPQETVRGLRNVIARLHEAGIAHGDLHHRDVLVSEADGSVAVVDLATAVRRGPTPGWVRRRVYSRLREQDLIAIARIEARLTGTDPDAAIEAVGADAAMRYRKARRWKAAWNRLRGKR